MVIMIRLSTTRRCESFQPSVVGVAMFLCHLFDVKGLKPATIKGYTAALAPVLHHACPNVVSVVRINQMI